MYALSTYKGHSYAPGFSLQHCSAMPQAMPRAISLSAPSMYQGNLQQIPYVLGMAECSIGTYYAIVQYHLVLLCTGTYYLVRRFTILRISSFRFGTSYVESWIAPIAIQLSTYEVPNQKRKPLGSSTVVQGSMYRYRAVQGGTVL